MIRPFNDSNGSFQARWDSGLFLWGNGEKWNMVTR
jgi:hypothetical protein